MTKALLLIIALTLLMTVALGKDNLLAQVRQLQDIRKVHKQDNHHVQQQQLEDITADANFEGELRSASDLMLSRSANSRTLPCIEKSNKKRNCTARGGSCMGTCPEEKATRLCRGGCSCCLPCHDTNKCLNNGGTCQAKTTTCAGAQVDGFCKGGCTCCLPIPTAIECSNNGGFCAAKTGNYCNGEVSILHNSCIDQCSCCVPDRPAFYLGGVGPEQPADAETQQLLNGVRGDVEAYLGRQVDEFTLVSYATQVVDGINYFAKVRIRSYPNEYIHIRVYQHWSGTLELEEVQVGKTLEEPINYF